MDNIVDVLIAMKFIPGIGDKTALEILKNYKEVNLQDFTRDLCGRHLTASQYEKFKEKNIDLAVAVKTVRQQMKEHNISVVSSLQPEYPSALAQLYSPPPLLFYKGNLTYNFSKSLAVVGARKCTRYGTHVCNKIMDVLDGSGCTIISGLADGIDSIAHTHALRHNLHCIGVVGHGLMTVYPSHNAELFQDILRTGGCIVSTFLPDVQPFPAFFPVRNRVIAGMARATLIVEAASKSGSLITASYAFDENRDVLAVPGEIFSEISSGTNELIRSGKAKLVSKPEDILQELEMTVIRHQNKISVNSRVYLLLQDEKLTSEELVLKSGLSIAEVAAEITELELLGAISPDNQQRWVII